MEVKNALILDADEPLSRALDEILTRRNAVIVMKNRSYLGILDDRNIRLGVADVSRSKCGNSCIKAPVIYPESTIFEKLNSFLTGHFKFLPAVAQMKRLPLGLISRIEILKDILSLRLIQKKLVSHLMNSPVHSIDLNSTLGNAKSKMKEFGTHHLVIINNGYPYGILSTFDIAAILKPKGRRDKEIITEVDKEGDLPLSSLVEEGLVVVNSDSLVEDAIKKMVDHNTAYVLVVSNKKPIGILAAVDVFKDVLESTKEQFNLSISGLSEDDQNYHDDIKNTLADTFKRFSKSFAIKSAVLHIKKGKSVYSAKILVDMDKDRLSVSAEDYKLNDTIASLAKEIYVLLSKKKGIDTNRKKSRVEE